MKPAFIAAGCGLLLAGLTLAVVNAPVIPGEMELVRLVIGLRNAPLTALIQALTFITSAAPALLLTLTLSGLEWRRAVAGHAAVRHAPAASLGARAWRVRARVLIDSRAYWPALAYLGALACNIALRVAVGRLPPEVDYVPHVLPELRADFQRFAFPSGHAGAAVAAYVSAAIVTVGRWPQARRWAWAVAGAIIAGTGLGRVYLGVHWPTDVAGGFLLAGLWLALSIHIRDNAPQRAQSSRFNTT